MIFHEIFVVVLYWGSFIKLWSESFSDRCCIGSCRPGTHCRGHLARGNTKAHMCGACGTLWHCDTLGHWDTHSTNPLTFCRQGYTLTILPGDDGIAEIYIKLLFSLSNVNVPSGQKSDPAKPDHSREYQVALLYPYNNQRDSFSWQKYQHWRWGNEGMVRCDVF